jgi:GNAT superfamily N-acetyltransferase
MYRICSPSTEEEFKKYYNLRWRMLRKPWDQPEGSEKDDKEGSSVHLMLCDEEDRILAIGRAHFNSPDEAQIRFMAVEEGYQKKGLGGIILKELEKRIIEIGAKYIILNARDTAIPFYKKHLYYEVKQTVSLFGAVPHHRMRKDLL